MGKHYKLVDKLTESDLAKYPVWRYCMDEGNVPDTAVEPVKELPVDDLGCKVVGVKVRLNNGKYVWALLSAIKASDPYITKHVLALHIYYNNKRFSLARYYDVDFSRRSPKQLAAFLGLKIEEVFPIEYDVSEYVIGDINALKGLIEAEPEVRLTRAQISKMAVH